MFTQLSNIPITVYSRLESKRQSSITASSVAELATGSGVSTDRNSRTSTVQMKKSSGSGDRPLLISASLAAAGKSLHL
jgi:hypothetical protein